MLSRTSVVLVVLLAGSACDRNDDPRTYHRFAGAPAAEVLEALGSRVVPCEPAPDARLQPPSLDSCRLRRAPEPFDKGRLWFEGGSDTTMYFVAVSLSLDDPSKKRLAYDYARLKGAEPEFSVSIGGSTRATYASPPWKAIKVRDKGHSLRIEFDAL